MLDIKILEECVGSLYVNSTSGEQCTEELIDVKETEPNSRKKALKAYKAATKPVRAFDSLGLINYWLRESGMSEVSSIKTLKNRCKILISKSLVDVKHEEVLQVGDYLFRYSLDRDKRKNYHHVGVYIGGGMVIHAKSRAEGVVCEHIEANSENYWMEAYRMKDKIRED